MGKTLNLMLKKMNYIKYRRNFENALDSFETRTFQTFLKRKSTVHRGTSVELYPSTNALQTRVGVNLTPGVNICTHWTCGDECRQILNMSRSVWPEIRFDIVILVFRKIKCYFSQFCVSKCFRSFFFHYDRESSVYIAKLASTEKKFSKKGWDGGTKTLLNSFILLR